MPDQHACADLGIRLLKLEEQGYPVEITLNSEQEFPRGYLAADRLPWTHGPSSQQDGQDLFDWLLADDELKRAWHSAAARYPRRRIRLRIDADAPELHAVPWELLRDTTGDGPQVDVAAAAATPFSRYLAGEALPGNAILTRPLKMLVAIANPANLADFGLEAIDAAAEFAALEAALDGLPITLTRFPRPPAAAAHTNGAGTPAPLPCTLAALEAELRSGYHILHFIGHGFFDPDADAGMLLLADDDNRLKPTAAGDFAAMLARLLVDEERVNDDKLRLIFLASCETATNSPADAFRGVATQTVQAGVPAVVAMQDMVPAETARRFAQTFYARLLEHGLADLASNEARSTLIAAGLPGAAIPVLYLRLRSGQLLRRAGRITSDYADSFWPFLLENIYRGQCLPFLGPQVTHDLLADRTTVALKLAEKYGYPLPDGHDLTRVAQFVAISDPDILQGDYTRILQRSLFDYLGLRPNSEDRLRYGRLGLSDTVQEVEWARHVRSLHEDEIHHLLADLDLPLYMTTNADSFMAEALTARERPARRVGPRWTRREADTPQYVLTPSPSIGQPVVFHLNGHDGDAEHERHLMLSEDDYLNYLVQLSRDQNQLLPASVIQKLSTDSFLFLGYRLDDWEFRILLQGLIRNRSGVGQSHKRHIGVQLEPEHAPSVEKARSYLGRYFGQFNIDIYWGTAQQFVSELHTHWQRYLEQCDDDWDL